MATKQMEDRLALLCDDCGVEIFVDVNMVMLKDDLWEELSDNVEDSYCHCCIEKRLDREIEVEDFRPMTGPDMTGTGLIPCNAMWLWENRREKYLELFPHHKNRV